MLPQVVAKQERSQCRDGRSVGTDCDLAGLVSRDVDVLGIVGGSIALAAPTDTSMEAPQRRHPLTEPFYATVSVFAVWRLIDLVAWGRQVKARFCRCGTFVRLIVLGQVSTLGRRHEAPWVVDALALPEAATLSPAGGQGEL